MSNTMGNESAKKSIKWSLNPFLIYFKISGIPAYYETESQKSRKNRILRYFWRFLSFTCLLLNCYFQIYNLIQNMKIELDWNIFNGIETAPTVIFKIFISFLRPVFQAGVPLIFTFQFYFSGRFQKILNDFQEIETKIVLTDSFYKKIRKGYTFLIGISLVV